MKGFVFRNNTVERFFDREYSFSGYGDISYIPDEAEMYVWWYQAPVKFDRRVLAGEIRGYAESMCFILSKVEGNKLFVALTMNLLFDVPFTDDDGEIKSAVAEYNRVLYDAGESNHNVRVVDISEFTRRYAESDLLDWKFYFLSQMGLNPRLDRDFKAWWKKKLDGILLVRRKCLVLDLDNTLWGGVLGEDGINGIRVGGDYPGKAFLYWQEALLQLSKFGVILTVCSKNNERDVMEVWEKNPFMVLKKEHFSAYRINWNDKASNLKELAAELNIGLDSFVFVDDSPAERELVRQTLPMVAVPEFPAQPYELPVFFKYLVEDYFKVYSITEEDKKKTEQYRANAARMQAAASFTDFRAFLESLDIHLTIEEANEFNVSRIAQMSQKTNQFNLTTHRYTDADLRGFTASGWRIWCVSVADKFGDNGITGCLMVTPEGEIDTFLLSCRILGKGVELAFVKKVLSMLREAGFEFVRARYVPSAKNVQVKDFYDKCGFACVKEDAEGTKEYELKWADADLNIEEYYHINVR